MPESDENNNIEEPYPRIFIAARNIINNGHISSHENSRVGIVKESYDGIGKVIVGESKDEGFFSKFFWQVVGLFFLVIAGVLVYMITEGKIPQMFSQGSQNNPIVASIGTTQTYATSTINITDLIRMSDSKNTSLERKEFLSTFYNTEVYGTGAFVDIDKTDQNYSITMNILNHSVECHFKSNDDRLLLLKKGQTVKFYGTYEYTFILWSVDNCVLGDWSQAP